MLKDKSVQKEKLTDLEARYSSDAIRRANTWIGAFALVIPLIATGLLVKYGWNILEPFTYIAGICLASLAFFLFIFLKIDFSFNGVRNYLAIIRKQNLFEKYGFEEMELEDTNRQIERLKSEIDRLNKVLDIENEAADML